MYFTHHILTTLSSSLTDELRLLHHIQPQNILASDWLVSVPRAPYVVAAGHLVVCRVRHMFT